MIDFINRYIELYPQKSASMVAQRQELFTEDVLKQLDKTTFLKCCEKMSLPDLIKLIKRIHDSDFLHSLKQGLSREKQRLLQFLEEVHLKESKVLSPIERVIRNLSMEYQVILGEMTVEALLSRKESLLQQDTVILNRDNRYLGILDFYKLYTLQNHKRRVTECAVKVPPIIIHMPTSSAPVRMDLPDLKHRHIVPVLLGADGEFMGVIKAKNVKNISKKVSSKSGEIAKEVVVSSLHEILQLGIESVLSHKGK